MSISSKISSITSHISDVYEVLTKAGSNLTNVDKNLENITYQLNERLVYFMNNGVDVVWNNWEKIIETGDIVTLESTINAPMKIELKGNFLQEGTPSPSTPQKIQVVTGENTITIANSDNSESANYTIHLGNMELCKTPDYEDYIYKENGKWYKYGAIGKATINGTENITINNSGKNYWYYQVNITSKLLAQSISYGNFLCDHYPNVNITNGNTTQGFNLNSSSSTTNMRIRYGTQDTVQNFKNWLSNNNIIVYAPLKTATVTEITDSTLINDLETLEKAKSYNIQTNISQTNQDLPFIINATALKSN